MGILFHLPTLVAFALVTTVTSRRKTPATWLTGAVLLGAIGSIATVAASGGSLFAVLRGGSWLVFAYLPLYTLLGAVALRDGLHESRPHATRLLATRLLGAVGVVTMLVGAWSFGLEPRWLEVTRHQVTSPKLDRPIRVAVVADLQTDHVGRYERRALAATLAESPDLVLLLGDYLQVGDPAKREAEARKLREILGDLDFTAPLGVYAVRGDVEVDGWEQIFHGTGVETFEKTTRIEKSEIVLTALSPRDARYRRAWPRRSDRFHIAFGHAPEFAVDQELLEKPSADLLLAGHTHGGQVRLPFLGPPITFSAVPRAWAAGRTDFANGGILIVSRGIGMERGDAPRLRFLCRPEIVVIDLVPVAAR